MSKGGGLWTIFSTKCCLLIGHKLWHVIKYWTLVGGEGKSFNFSLFSDIHIQGKKTFEILTGFETVGNLSVLLGESATHSHLSKPPT